jgi:hypothetical protein
MKDRYKGQYTLENICGPGCPCHFKEHYTHLNLVRKRMKEGINTPEKLPERKHINVRGRIEHEAIIKDAAWCKELGIDQAYETMKYLKRWGEWLGQ